MNAGRNTSSRWWARRVVSTSVAFAMVLSASGCGSGNPEADEQSGAVVGEPLPSLAVAPLGDGDTASLEDIEGAAVVNLWATWCAPCRKEMPEFERVHQELGDEVTIVGLNIDSDTAAAEAFLDEIGVTYDQVSDTDARATVDLRVASMPSTIILDADGVVTDIHAGELDAEELTALVERAL